MPVGNKFANDILNVVRGASLVRDPTTAIAQGIDEPNSEAVFTKPTDASYADVPATISMFGLPGDRRVSNILEIDFGQVTGTPGTIVREVRSAGLIDGAGNFIISGSLARGESFEDLDESYFPIGRFELKWDCKPEYVGNWLANAILGVPTKGQTLTAPSKLSLSLLSNRPAPGVVNSPVPQIEAIDIPCEAGQWLEPTARATHNLVVLEFPAASADIEKILGWQLADPSSNVWWQGSIDPAKMALQNYILKIAPEGVLLEV